MKAGTLGTLMGIITVIFIFGYFFVFVFIPAGQMAVSMSNEAEPFCVSNGFLAYNNIGGIGYCYDNTVTKEIIYMNDHWTFLEK